MELRQTCGAFDADGSSERAVFPGLAHMVRMPLCFAPDALGQMFPVHRRSESRSACCLVRSKVPMHKTPVRCCVSGSNISFAEDDDSHSTAVTFEFGPTVSREDPQSGVQQSESPWMDCTTCNNSGFVPCRTCGATGMVKRSSSPNMFYCPDCVGHKKLRCPACGGKCYMCE